LLSLTQAIIVYRILYALPAWGGFLCVELCNKINALALSDLAISVTLLLFLSYYKMPTEI